MILCFFFVLLVTNFAQGQMPDPCTQYKLINEPNRHSSYLVQHYDNLICDRMMNPDWYRFKDGDMPFGTCITPYRCGTHVPLWINGSIPTAAEGIVSRTACGTYKNSVGANCCQVSTPIYVKNCAKFLVYYLRPTPACSMAYCSGDQLSCGADKYSPTGFPPCVDGYPKLTSKPHLSNPIIVGNEYMFTCEVDYPTNKMDATFEVTWLLDGQPIAGVPTRTLTGNQRVAELYSDNLKGNLNKDLSCAVRTSFTDGHTGGMVSPPVTSNEYWTGIKLTTDRVDVDENSHKDVSIVSTVPIVCNKKGQTNCRVTFTFNFNEDFLTTDPCKVQLTPTSWNQMTLSAMTSFNISLSPSLIPFQQTGQVMISINGTGTNYLGQKLPNIQVHLTSTRPSAQCISTGDPHIKTFDQRNKRYNNYLVGQFTMVQRRHSSFRVEARTWKCGRVSCNCGIAMREGNDVITVDMCHGHYGKAVPKVEIKNPAMYTNKSRVVKEPSGNAYVVSFDSGANIKIITRRGRVLDVYITVPGTFHSDTEGLCGYFDGDIRNELTRKDGQVDPFKPRPNPFISSWSIPIGESLFEKAEPLHMTTQPLQNGCPTTNKPPNTGMNLCPVCVPVPGVNLVSPSQIQTTPATHGSTPGMMPGSTPGVLPGSTPGMMPGSTPGVLPGSTPGMMPGSSPRPVTTVVTTPYNFVTSGPNPDLTPLIDKLTATKRCNTILQKYPSTKQCTTNGFYVDYTVILDMCVIDLQMTNDSTMALSALSALLEQCAHSIMISNTTIQNGTIVPPPQAIPCLGACSGNGECRKGVCVCDKGFTSSDCSVDTRKPPVIVDVPGNVCDIQTQGCFTPMLVGNNMLNSIEAKCIINQVQLSTQKKNRAYALPTQMNTQFLSTSNVICPIPKPLKDKALGQYTISLVNENGKPISNNVTYQYYNSKCQTCDVDFKCQIKAGTCSIDNVCYLKDDKDLKTKNGVCNPDVDQTSWTRDNNGKGNSSILTLPPIFPGNVGTTAPTTAKPAGTGNSDILTLPPIFPGNVGTTAPTTAKPAGSGNSDILTLPPIFPGNVETTAPTTAKPAGTGNSDILTLPPIFPGNVGTTAPTTAKQAGTGNSDILTLPPIFPGNADTTTAPTTAKPAGTGNSDILTLPPIFPENVDTTAPSTSAKPAGTGNSDILTLPPIFPGNLGGSKVNHTASSSGCACVFDPSLTDCACCQNFGCPCPKDKMHFCYDCVDVNTCGQ